MIKLASSVPGTSKAKGFALSTLDPPLLVIDEDTLDSSSPPSDPPKLSFVSLAVTVPGRSVSVLLFAVTEIGAVQRLWGFSVCYGTH